MLLITLYTFLIADIQMVNQILNANLAILIQNSFIFGVKSLTLYVI